MTSRGRAGLGLVEALVALAVAALVVAALARSAAAILRCRAATEARQRSLWAATAALEEMLATPAARLPIGARLDTVPGGPAGVLERDARVAPGPAENLRRLTVSVRAAGAAPVLVETLRLVPWSAP